MRTKQYEATEDFKARIAALSDPKLQEDKPCVRKPSDRGYYPPTRNVQAPGQEPTLLSKWWLSESCQRALERAAMSRKQRIQKLRETVATNDERKARELATWLEVDS